MFWIGLIVGGIIGFVAGLVFCCSLAVKMTGSFDKAAAVGDVIIKASENRESVICAYHEDDLLDYVVLEEN